MLPVIISTMLEDHYPAASASRANLDVSEDEIADIVRRAWIPTARSAALGEMTPRSVTGVNAPAGNPGNELFAGVVAVLSVAVLCVVRSLLSKQLTSTSALLNAPTISVQVSAACADAETKKVSAAAMPQILANMELPPLVYGRRMPFLSERRKKSSRTVGNRPALAAAGRSSACLLAGHRRQ